MAVRLLEQETGEHATPASSGNYWAAPYYTAAEHFHLFGGGSKNAITLSGIQNSRKSLDTAVTRYEMAVLANNVLANAPGYHVDTSGAVSYTHLVRIQTAMDRYVHITEESMEEAVHQFKAVKIAAS